MFDSFCHVSFVGIHVRTCHMTVLSEERVASDALLAVSFPQPRGGGGGCCFGFEAAALLMMAQPHINHVTIMLSDFLLSAVMRQFAFEPPFKRCATIHLRFWLFCFEQKNTDPISIKLRHPALTLLIGNTCVYSFTTSVCYI